MGYAEVLQSLPSASTVYLELVLTIELRVETVTIETSASLCTVICIKVLGLNLGLWKPAIPVYIL